MTSRKVFLQIFFLKLIHIKTLKTLNRILVIDSYLSRNMLHNLKSFNFLEYAACHRQYLLYKTSI